MACQAEGKAIRNKAHVVLKVQAERCAVPHLNVVLPELRGHGEPCGFGMDK